MVDKKPAFRRLFALAAGVSGLVSLGLCGACDNSKTLHQQIATGGESTYVTSHLTRFDLPAPALNDAQKADFYAGRALAHQPWVKAPTSTTARDGLGPLFNARSCLGCHIEGGRGTLPDDNSEAVFTAFVRLSIPGEEQKLGSVPEPGYGQQIQTQATGLMSQLGLPPGPDDLKPEADLRINWQYHSHTYPDGRVVELREPELDLRQLSYGELHPDTLFSLRQAPGMFGTGLIAAIKQADIDALADPADENRDGISGRVNQVWSVSEQATVPGRFGWKANRPDLEVTVAAAFADDIGISNPLFPVQPCTSVQSLCQQQPNGNNADGFEIPEDLLHLVVEFLRHTGTPAARLTEDLNAGQEAFNIAGCQQCHQPSFITAENAPAAHLANQRIWPYSDFLLHDMGPLLADERPDFQATGSEWRTAPLWGIGLQKTVGADLSLLHDGRARSVEEAILWHGGEAAKARALFEAMSADTRRQLIAFVEAL